MDKVIKSEVVSNLLWAIFGIGGAYSYYSKSDYLVCALMSLIGIFYGLRLIRSFSSSPKD